MVSDVLLTEIETHTEMINFSKTNTLTETRRKWSKNKKAVLPQGNRAMPQVFFSVEVRQQHSLQV